MLFIRCLCVFVALKDVVVLQKGDMGFSRTSHAISKQNTFCSPSAEFYCELCHCGPAIKRKKKKTVQAFRRMWPRFSQNSGRGNISSADERWLEHFWGSTAIITKHAVIVGLPGEVLIFLFPPISYLSFIFSISASESRSGKLVYLHRHAGFPTTDSGGQLAWSYPPEMC